MNILTFTANILAESMYYVDTWAEGKTARATKESFSVAGKGINVSRMLNRLHAENTALCFPGGIFGPHCRRWLEEKEIRYQPFIESCETRSGSVIRSPGKEETTFLGIDSFVSDSAIQSCAAAIAETPAPLLLAICGSIPQWDSQKWEPLRQCIKNRSAETILAVDSYGPSLHWFVTQNPDLIKINRQEIETLFPKNKDEPTPELLERATSLSSTDKWIITNGAETIWYREGGSIASCEPERAACISPVGCGDVFYATLLDSLYNKTGYTLGDAISKASHYGALNAAHPGIAEFDL